MLYYLKRHLDRDSLDFRCASVAPSAQSPIIYVILFIAEQLLIVKCPQLFL